MEQPNSTTFIDQLERTPDPRRARGRSYEWRVLLAIISAALVSGQATPRGIAQPTGRANINRRCWPSCSQPRGGYPGPRHATGSYAR